MTETEIKLHWPAAALEARALIEQLGYVLSAPRTLEADQLFDLSSGALAQSDRLLRLRRTYSSEEGPHALVTFKGPATREVYKSREEIEFDVSDPDAFALVLDRVGYHPTFLYEKYRSKFTASGEPGLITIDETPIGIYLELEGPQTWIDSTAARLGFPVTRYLTASYGALYRKYREQNPDAGPDMTFGLQDPYKLLTKLP